MLLCPPSTQTSPTRMFSRVRVLSLPCTVMCCGSAFAGMAVNVTFQARSLSAVAVWA